MNAIILRYLPGSDFCIFGCRILLMLGDCVSVHAKFYSHKAISSYNAVFLPHIVPMNGISRNIFFSFCGSRASLVWFSFFSLVSRGWNGVNGTAANQNGFRFQELQFFSLDFIVFPGLAICSVDRQYQHLEYRTYDISLSLSLSISLSLHQFSVEQFKCWEMFTWLEICACRMVIIFDGFDVRVSVHNVDENTWKN